MRYTNPFADTTNIQIRLLRSGEDNNNANKDDRIAIHHKGENVYHLYYRDGDVENSNHIAHMTVLEGEELDTYLLNLFRLMALDRQPFADIQFMIPGCPSLIFKVADLRRKVLRRRLMNLMPLMHSVSRVHV